MKLTEEDVATGFMKIDDSFAITKGTGSYQQLDLYEREGAIFCKKGSGYLKIYDTGHTSKDGVMCVGINMNGKKWKVGKFGMLEVVK